MWKDPVVEEVREIRDRLASRFGYNVAAIAEHLRKKEEEKKGQLVWGATRVGDTESRVSEDSPREPE